MGIKEHIRNNEGVYEGEKAIKYVFCDGGNSDILIVTFPGFASPGIQPQYNYIRTLIDCNCHRLYILDDYGPRGSYLIGKNGDHSIEDSVVSLISTMCDKYGVESGNVILQGSSKGGYCALYFGIKYNFGYVIAGAPQINLGNYLLKVAPDVAEYITGGKNEENKGYLNGLLFDLVDLSSGRFPKIFIHVGRGDHHYPNHIVPFLEKLDEKGKEYKINLANYSSHGWVGSYYQEYLLKTLNYIDDTIINPKPSILKTTINYEYGLLKVTCNAQGDNLKYACYVFKENDVIETIYYQIKPYFEYPIHSNGVYRARVYVMENTDVNSTFTDEIIIKDHNHPPTGEGLFGSQQENIETFRNYSKNGEELLQKIDDLDEFFFKPGEINDKEFLIEICEYLSAGNLFINIRLPLDGFTYEKRLKYDIKNFDWDMNYSLAPNMCQLYLQAFLPIKYLILGYNISSNHDYLDLASEFIESWLEYEPNSNNRFTWYDHSTSDRVLVMIYFILTAKKDDIVKYDQLISEMNQSIKKHAEFLYDDSNYLYNNHGTMIDKSLYIVSKFLDDSDSERYKRKSIHRLKKSIKINFSPEMVYLENSIGYHLFSLNFFFTIEKLILNPLGDTLGEILNRSAVRKSIDFLIHALKPDYKFPVIGDTFEVSLDKIDFHVSLFEKNYPPLKWVLSSGVAGSPPEEFSKVYQNEGYAFFHNSWDFKNPDEITHASFRAGFLTTIHKHADDLSFTLFAKGKDIFVDSGVYTYENGDFKDFFSSAQAHNTVVVDDHTYPFREGTNEDTGILDYGEEEDYYYVVGKNDMYNGVNITRSFYFLKNGDVVIIDDIQSPEIHNYSQYYQLGPKITVDDIEVKSSEDSIRVIVHGGDINVNLNQIRMCDFDYVKGDKNKAGPGIVSEVYEHLEETISLKFSLESNEARFITFITVNEKNEKNEAECYVHSFNNESTPELIILGDEQEIKIPLKEYNRKMSRYLSVQQNDANSFTFTVTQAEEDETFAWYVLKNGERIDIIWYTSNPVLNYTFQKPGEYEIKYFIKKGEETKMHSLTRFIHITNEDTPIE